MTEPLSFLISIGRVLAVSRIYAREHPARETALMDSYDRLQNLLEVDPEPRFTILHGDILHHRAAVEGVRDANWAKRLERVGIRRIELRKGVSADEYFRFIQEITHRLSGEGTSATAPQFAPTHIRYGSVAAPDGAIHSQQPERTSQAPVRLADEIGALRWLQEEVGAGRALPVGEAEVVVRCLALAMHQDRQMVLPLLELRNFDEYTTTHANNVAVLTMALAEALGYPPADVRALGVSGLLHDIGKTKIPRDILIKPGALTELERRTIERHTVEGARMLLSREGKLELAAIVAYEHHRHVDGSGYPALAVPRVSHAASRIVHVCDVFDALCTERPYRPAWSVDRALDEIESGSGTRFESDLVRAFTAMIRVAGHSRMTIDEAIADDPVSALAATDVPMDSDQNGNAGRNVNPSRA
jgi:putative nucleotidyltransferase with HDIG domain